MATSFKEAVVHVNEQTKKETHLGGTERCRSVFNDALEGDKTRLAQLFAAALFDLVLFLLPFGFGSTLLFPSLLLGLELGHTLLTLGFPFLADPTHRKDCGIIQTGLQDVLRVVYSGRLRQAELLA